MNEVPLLHAATGAGTADGRGAAEVLAAALGTPVRPRPFAPGEREAARGAGVPGAWALLGGEDLLAAAPCPEARTVVLPRRDPRWSLEDPLHRGIEHLPPGARVVAGSPLGAALLRRCRADLVPVPAGAFPVAEETPVLVGVPLEGSAATPLDPAAFVPAPGTGLLGFAAPAGEEIPPAVRALADEGAAVALRIERAFLAGLGPLPAGASVGALARRKVSVMFSLRAVLFLPGEAPRDLHADIPLANASQFARSLGRHLARA